MKERKENCRWRRTEMKEQKEMCAWRRARAEMEVKLKIERWKLAGSRAMMKQ